MNPPLCRLLSLSCRAAAPPAVGGPSWAPCMGMQAYPCIKRCPLATRASLNHTEGMPKRISRLTAQFIILIVTLTALPSACADARARIYVYVQMETPARSWFPIWCDGNVIARIKRGRFFVIFVAPGRHMLSDEKGVPVFVNARSGQKSFVRLDWHVNVGGPEISVLNEVSPGTAHSDMIYLSYIDTNQSLSGSVPKADPREPPQLRRRGEGDGE